MRSLLCLAVLFFVIFPLSAQEPTDLNSDLILHHAQTNQDSLVYQNLTSINSVRNEYVPQFYQDGLLFLSDRGRSNDLGVLYTATEILPREYTKAQPLSTRFATQNIAGLTFSKDQNTLYISLAKVKTTKKRKPIIHTLYQSRKVKGKWSKPRKLSLNQKGYSSTYPVLSSDGERLYFVSDRPGGFGENDLYVCYRQGEKWSEPFNLGGEVNSGEQETTPFIDAQGLLYFSSNGHGGYGNLDIFRTYQKADTSLAWQKPINLGKGFNSRRDDLGFWLNETEYTGFFTSNRGGGAGGKDIYFWELFPPEVDLTSTIQEKSDFKTITVFDRKTSSPMKDVALTIQDELGNQFAETTDSSGNVSLEITENHDYVITVQQKGYATTLIQVSTAELIGDGKYYIGLERSACQLFSGKVTGDQSTKGIEFVKLNFWNRCTETAEEVYTDAEGKFDFCAMCDCVFLLTMSREGYYLKTENLTTEDRECDFGQPIIKNFQLETLLPEETEGSSPAMVELAKEEPTRAEPTVGEFTRLTKLYYNFNSSTLSKSAQEELENWIVRLQEDSTAQVQIMSHTDSRGNAKYNQKLSQRRADEVALYLQQKGIATARISATGMGEVSPLNDCTDGVPCSSTAHRLNRRTELRIWHPKGGGKMAMVPEAYDKVEALPLKKKVESFPTIYYGFESHLIDASAQEELDQVAFTLQEQENLKIEIRAHTDSRGTAAYNQQLSQKRADQVVQYLVSKGVEPSRLLSRGYGESEPLNDCADNFPCSSAAHRLNRRTELVVVE